MTRWVLFDDPQGRELRPLTWLRPASGLLLGAEIIEARWRRLVKPDPVEVVCRDLLAPLAPGRIGWRGIALALAGRRPEGGEGAVRVRDLLSEQNLWVSDLMMADGSLPGRLRELPPDGVARISGAAAAFRPGPRILKLAQELADEGGVAFPALPLQVLGAAAEVREIEAERLRGLGDLMRLQDSVLAEDLERLLEDLPPAAGSPGDGQGYALERVRLEEGCRVDLGAVLDAREGPIVLGEGCQVFPHTWLRGPLFAGAHCRFLGGSIGGGSSFGPQCRVRGEVEASIFLGYDNKAHDGFIGHSVLGEWVNLGALTTTSDLKNNYSTIALERDGRREDTGLRKLGVFLGDHVKTRIGCLLTCGTVVGVGSTLIGDPAVAERRIADFSWGAGDGAAEYEVNKFLRTAEIVMERRGVRLTPDWAEALRAVHAESRLPGMGAEAPPGSRASQPG